MKPNFGYMKIFAALLLALLTVFAPAVRDLHVLQHDCKTVENCPVCDFQFSEFFEAEVTQTPAPEFFYIESISVRNFQKVISDEKKTFSIRAPPFAA